jgi:hypothetical protein
LLEKPNFTGVSGARAPPFLEFLQFFPVFGRKGPETGSAGTDCTTNVLFSYLAHHIASLGIRPECPLLTEGV